jgi:poly(3-hydroxyalkanoate) synthetase
MSGAPPDAGSPDAADVAGALDLLLGGWVTFVLSTSGQIASMINSPANPKAYPVQCTAPGTYVHDR